MRRAEAATGETLNDRVRSVTKVFARELATVGAATGGVAAIPGAGTTVSVATSVADVGWFTVRMGDLILTIAVLHGHGQSSVEERRAWILTILAFGNSASASFTRAARELGIGLGSEATRRIPPGALRAINRRLGRRIVTKYGTKRGALAIGRALPFGIGAVIGGTGNYAWVRTVGHQADKFFRELAYSDDGRRAIATAERD